MNDDRKPESSDASKPPPFVFVWEPSQSAGSEVDTLLIWPLAEKRPPGAFARYLVIEGQRIAPPLVVPIDLDSTDRPAAAGSEDLGTLPLLLRLPFEDRFTVTIKYLVRRKIDGLVRVEEVELPPFKFRRAIEANRFTTIGFVRGENTDGPARPIVVTGIERPIDQADGLADDALMDIEMVDTIHHAYEKIDASAKRRVTAGFVLVVPHADDQIIGPARTIFPYASARVRTTMEIVQRAVAGQTGSAGDQLYYPRFNLRIGASRRNQDLLLPGITFFHWNRMAGFVQSAHDSGHVRARHAPPLTFADGTMRGMDLSFTFDTAGFGDVVGVMVGPPEGIVPVFTDWLNNEERFFRHTLDDWTIVPFLWTGDELMPLNYYVHSDLDAVKNAVNGDLVAAAHEQPRPPHTDSPRNLARYLQPPARNSTPEIGRLIKATLDEQPHHSVIALDPYCELLRELDRQIRQDGGPNEWLRLEELFAFAMFDQFPELHRALVVLKDLRRAMPPDFAIETTAFADTSVLAVVMAAIGLPASSDQSASRWLKALSPANFIAAWELMKRESHLLSKLTGAKVVPDLTMLSDWFDGRAAKTLQIYADYPLADLSEAVRTLQANGHRHDAAVLQEAYEHRRDAGNGNNMLAYEQIAAVVELLEAGPVRRD